MIDTILAWLGLSKAATVGGFIGALVSAMFLPGAKKVGWLKTAGMVLGGMATAAYLTPLAHHLTSLTVASDGAISFLIGLFGMSITAAGMKAIPEWVESARKKLFGGQP